MRMVKNTDVPACPRPEFADLAVVVAIVLPFAYLLGFVEITSFLYRAGAHWVNLLVQPQDILVHSLLLVFSISVCVLTLLYLSVYADKLFSWIERFAVPMGITPLTFGTGDKAGTDSFDGVQWLPVSYVNNAIALTGVIVISVCIAIMVRAWFEPKKNISPTWGVFVVGFLSINSLTTPHYFAAIRLDRVLNSENFSAPFQAENNANDKRILIDKIGGAYLVRIESPPEKRGFALMSNLDGYIRK